MNQNVPRSKTVVAEEREQLVPWREIERGRIGSKYEIIAARKANALEYEEYLKRIAELAKRVEGRCCREGSTAVVHGSG
jgi:hypothetical protein